MSVPAHLKYTRDHFWIRIEGDRAIIGLTDYGIMELGMVVFIELPEMGTFVQKGQFLGTIETISDDEHDTFAPLSGQVVAVNLLLDRSIHMLHESPYDKGWLYSLKFSEEAELEQLWDAQTYERAYEEVNE
ncbi:glycine cleavage system protein H [Paenibacillus sp. SI8]|uniref:glycine cleavage system protein H n=1 Tax=unclassified Paenibacillus TaxID=185978 RepID=UPI0034665529